MYHQFIIWNYGFNFITGVQFQSNSSTAPEANGFVQFLVELTIQSDIVITVQVCTEETTPVSAKGLLTQLSLKALNSLVNFSYRK